MKHLHYLQHVPFEDIGTIQDWAEASGMHIGGTRLFNNEQLPSVQELDWLVIMGGPMNVYEESVFPWLRAEKRLIQQAVERRKIVLGICLGAQLIADALGARVRSNGQKEIGWYPVFKTESETGQAAVLSAIPDGLEVLHWHGDTFDLPEGAVHLGRSAACENQGFVIDERVLGLQFHLEITFPSLERLIHSCRNDIDEGPFVQRPEVMLADKGRFDAANAVLNQILDCLAEVGR